MGPDSGGRSVSAGYGRALRTDGLRYYKGLWRQKGAGSDNRVLSGKQNGMSGFDAGIGAAGQDSLPGN